MTEKPLTELMRDLIDQVAKMIRHEIGLARAEMSEKASQAGSGIGMLAAALVFGIAALVILLLAAVLALNEIMDPWASALLVGIVAALVAFALAARGKANLRARNLMPSRTMQSLRSDAHFARERMR
jgi:VIT1/CCC1 family predicted Fe2+/Mn2+ transporter